MTASGVGADGSRKVLETVSVAKWAADEVEMESFDDENDDDDDSKKLTGEDDSSMAASATATSIKKRKRAVVG